MLTLTVALTLTLLNKPILTYLDLDNNRQTPMDITAMRWVCCVHYDDSDICKASKAKQSGK